jgi:hypothetical protein
MLQLLFCGGKMWRVIRFASKEDEFMAPLLTHIMQLVAQIFNEHLDMNHYPVLVYPTLG